MKLKYFINDLRGCITDAYADTLEAWFEAAGRLYLRGEQIPLEWEYSPGAWPCDEDSPWYEVFENTETEDLWNIANWCSRYMNLLKRHGNYNYY